MFFFDMAYNFNFTKKNKALSQVFLKNIFSVAF